jgi:hypothetical protein
MPPANVTFQGKVLSHNQESKNKFLCQRQTVEFILTDDQGGKRVDKFNFQQAKFPAAKIIADRSQDLRIQVKDFVYRQGVNIQTSSLDLNLIIGKDTQESTTSEIRTFSKKYRPDNQDQTRPLFDRDTQTLIIPTAILKNIKAKTTSMGLAVQVIVFNKRPDDSVLTRLLTYHYQIPSIKVEFK